MEACECRLGDLRDFFPNLVGGNSQLEFKSANKVEEEGFHPNIRVSISFMMKLDPVKWRMWGKGRKGREVVLSDRKSEPNTCVSTSQEAESVGIDPWDCVTTWDVLEPSLRSREEAIDQNKHSRNTPTPKTHTKSWPSGPHIAGSRFKTSMGMSMVSSRCTLKQQSVEV